MQLDIFRSATGPRRVLILAIIVTCILIVACTSILLCVQKFAGESPVTPNGGTPDGNGDSGKVEYVALPVASDDVYSRGTLLVVNNDTKIHVYPSDSRLVKIEAPNKSDSYKVKTSAMRLDSDALAAFNSMLDAYYTETGDNTVIITSAYRTEAEQEALISSSVKAGFSDHHLALSVALKRNDSSGTSELPDGHWIYENCYKYGFIQRYPEGKEESTGDTQRYFNCLRYVGVAHATYMHENDLSLEEYVAAVKGYTYEGTHLAVTAGGARYEIYYVPANLTGGADALTTLPVPKELEYSYSGNNTDGFIVTVKLGAVAAE